MKRILILLALLLVIASCDGHSPTDPSSGHSATLSGVVTDSRGNPWGGVSIGLVQSEVAASGLTDDHGRYSIKTAPGHYRVWLQLGRTGPGYFVNDVDLIAGQNTYDIVSR
ncbi:MAG TPA: carboxypeptidase-like regulatory domain-containing protein [Thermoanaerobaculia bacterium]|nr:carboxypeptidase-like regulatory domain-containing protein [Thermoanaerobaculia bacterium]